MYVLAKRLDGGVGGGGALGPVLSLTSMKFPQSTGKSHHPIPNSSQKKTVSSNYLPLKQGRHLARYPQISNIELP